MQAGGAGRAGERATGRAGRFCRCPSPRAAPPAARLSRPTPHGLDGAHGPRTERGCGVRRAETRERERRAERSETRAGSHAPRATVARPPRPPRRRRTRLRLPRRPEARGKMNEDPTPSQVANPARGGGRPARAAARPVRRGPEREPRPGTPTDEPSSTRPAAAGSGTHGTRPAGARATRLSVSRLGGAVPTCGGCLRLSLSCVGADVRVWSRRGWRWGLDLRRRRPTVVSEDADFHYSTKAILKHRDLHPHASRIAHPQLKPSPSRRCHSQIHETRLPDLTRLAHVWRSSDACVHRHAVLWASPALQTAAAPLTGTMSLRAAARPRRRCARASPGSCPPAPRRPSPSARTRGSS